MKLGAVFVLGVVSAVAAVDNSRESVTKQWLEIKAQLEDTLAEHSKDILRLITPTMMEIDIEPECLGALKRLQTGLRDLDVQYTRRKC